MINSNDLRYIDLHVHSTASDGTLSPSEIVSYAAGKGLAAVALTDHDTVNGIADARKAADALKDTPTPIRLIPGVEVSAQYHGKEIHMLGLFINDQDPDFVNLLSGIVEKRNLRNKVMIERFNKAQIPMTQEALTGQDPNAVVTRAHFAKYLLSHGYVKTMDEAFKKYLGESGPCYVPREYLTPEEAIYRITKNGGISVLAHPILYHLPDKELERLVEQLSANGLVGLEAVYSSNMGYDEEKLKKLAGRYGLLITGGSDFHGKNKPDLDIGTGRGNLKIPYSILERLEAYYTGRSDSSAN